MPTYETQSNELLFLMIATPNTREGSVIPAAFGASVNNDNNNNNNNNDSPSPSLSSSFLLSSQEREKMREAPQRAFGAGMVRFAIFTRLTRNNLFTPTTRYIKNPE